MENAEEETSKESFEAAMNTDTDLTTGATGTDLTEETNDDLTKLSDKTASSDSLHGAGDNLKDVDGDGIGSSDQENEVDANTLNKSPVPSQSTKLIKETPDQSQATMPGSIDSNLLTPTESQTEEFKSFLEKSVVQQQNLSPGSVKDKAHDDAQDEHLQKLCNAMFNKMTLYLHGEVESTVEDYALLEKMNKLTNEKYKGMLHTAKNVGDSLRQINQKFVDLRPYLEQIEQIEQTVLTLEQAAYKLDAYTKKLEEKFRRIERK